MVKRPVGRPRKIPLGEPPKSSEGIPRPDGLARSEAVPAEAPGAGEAVDPGAIPGPGSEGGAGEDTRRKRGRPRKAEAPQDLAALLVTGHFMLAQLLKVEQLMIDDAEAEKLGKALDRVQKLYDRVLVSEETAAWMNLIMVAGSVYGPRWIAIRAQRKGPKPVAEMPKPQETATA
jgi:hypothetical protein